MTRLTACIVAIAFFLQQGNCCCGDSVCNVWVSVLAASESCCSSHEHDESDCHHDDESETPAHSHEHHLCVGTHLFYLDTSVDAAPDSLELVFWYVPVLEDADLRSVSDGSLLPAYWPVHSNSLPTLPLRAELQVFQI